MGQPQKQTIAIGVKIVAATGPDELMVGLLIEGESLEVLAERQGRSRQAAAVARGQAIRIITRALAA